MNFVVSICFNVLVMIINYIILYLYIYVLSIFCSFKSHVYQSNQAIFGQLLFAQHVSPQAVPPPMGKSITMADSNDPIPYIPSNETMNQTEPNSRRNPYWYHVLQAAHLREVELVPWMFHGV